MNKIKLLDCTLRDGGYCNNWEFGHQNAIKIVKSLTDAGIDIIECGFLTNKVSYDFQSTRFTDLAQFGQVIPKEREGHLYVCMVNYGEYNPDELPEYDGSSVDGIRLAFHKKDLDHALEFGRRVVEKGYKLFVQAMVSMSYSDAEFLDLIEKVNNINPYAFYIVDSFGVMTRKNLIRFFYLVEHNLKPGIWIGYHAHNNMQLAFSNAQVLVDTVTQRDLIIDTSVYGMGRGAGNLNTELFVNYLNESNGSDYGLRPLLRIIDEVLNRFTTVGRWGYSLANYLSAAHNCHPNYAYYLDDKKTLTIENMDEIFSMISEEKRASYDKNYIEDLYTEYMGRRNEQKNVAAEDLFKGRTVLVIAPGPSAERERERIVEMAERKDVLSVGINFDYPYVKTDLIFLSNLRRFQDLKQEHWSRTIVTSNIPCPAPYRKVDYTQLLNDQTAVKDNAGMMLLKLLISSGAREIYIAGMDGYSHDSEENYAKSDLKMSMSRNMLEEINEGMRQMIAKFSQEVKISFLTNPKYILL